MRRAILLLILAVLLAGWAKTPKIKVSILYPNALQGNHIPHPGVIKIPHPYW